MGPEFKKHMGAIIEMMYPEAGHESPSKLSQLLLLKRQKRIDDLLTGFIDKFSLIDA